MAITTGKFLQLFEVPIDANAGYKNDVGFSVAVAAILTNNTDAVTHSTGLTGI